MANRLTFSRNGPARSFYASLPYDDRKALDEILEYIKDFPFEHGDIITKRFAPPVYIYVYRDDEWRISYGLSFHRGSVYCDIGIWAISRVEPEAA